MDKEQILISEQTKNPYSIKYSDYFEYNSDSADYTYRLKIKNYNNNTTWPMDACLNCNADLKSHPAKVTNVSLGKNISTRAFGWILTLVLAAGVFTFYFLKINFMAWITGAILIVLFFFFRFLAKSISKPVIFYHCSKCSALLRNKTPEIIQIPNPPKEVFSKLEQIPGFQLE